MKLWPNIRESVLVKEAATVVSGNVLAQVISLLAYLVLTRIFSPSDYALFNIFYSYIEVLVILSTCKYELAVIVAQNEHESFAILRFTLRMNAWVSLLLLTIAATLYLTGTLPGDFSSLGAIVLLIPPMVFFSGTSRVYSALFNRLHQYRLIATCETTNATIGSLLKAFLGLMGLKQAGLPLGAVLGQAATNMVYRLRLHRLPLPHPSHSEQLAAARKHRNFPLFVASKDFINSLSSSLPFLWLALYFDRVDVGLFGLAFTIVFRPVNLINNAIEASEDEETPDIHITLKCVQSYLHGEISNHVRPEKITGNPDLHSTKPDTSRHGLGLRIVRETIRRCDGMLQMGLESGYYKAVFMLPLEEREPEKETDIKRST